MLRKFVTLLAALLVMTGGFLAFDSGAATRIFGLQQNRRNRFAGLEGPAAVSERRRGTENNR